MKSGSNLEKVFAAGHFAVTAELGPPKGPDISVVEKKAGFLIQGDDRPGALAENLKVLADAGINVAAVDGLSAGSGRWGAIVWVADRDVRRAGSVLRAKAK